MTDDNRPRLEALDGGRKDEAPDPGFPPSDPTTAMPELNGPGFWVWTGQAPKAGEAPAEGYPVVSSARYNRNNVRGNANRFGEDPYPGEARDMTDTLDGKRQQVAQHLGTEHPLFHLIDEALRSGDLEALRVACAAADDYDPDHDPDALPF